MHEVSSTITKGLVGVSCAHEAGAEHDCLYIVTHHLGSGSEQCWTPVAGDFVRTVLETSLSNKHSQLAKAVSNLHVQLPFYPLVLL